MTLLITVATKDVIHQASDYRISSRGIEIDTRNGAKQLSVSGVGWTAMLAFTGIVSDGHRYSTVAWIVSAVKKLQRHASVSDLVEMLVSEGSASLALSHDSDRRLSIVAAFADGIRCRLFSITNWEKRPGLADHLAAREIRLGHKPRVIIAGATRVLPRSTRPWLKRIAVAGDQHTQIRSTLRRVIQRAHLQQPTEISPDCWIETLPKDGRSIGENAGNVAGFPANVHVGVGDVFAQLNLAALVAKLLPGKKAVLGQTVGFSLKATPSPGPVGPSRSIGYAIPSAAWEGTASGFPRLTLVGGEGVVEIQKNSPLLVEIGRLELQIDPAARHEAQIEFTIESIPNIAGLHPTTWSYTVQLAVGPKECAVTILQLSTGLRRRTEDSDSSIGVNEEIVLVAPVGSRTLRASPSQPIDSAVLRAQLILRDWPELWVGS